MNSLSAWFRSLSTKQIIVYLVLVAVAIYVVWYVIDALEGLDPNFTPPSSGSNESQNALGNKSFGEKEETPEPEAKKAEAKAEAPAPAPAAKQPAAPQAAAQVQATAVAVTKAAGGTKGVGAGAIQLKAPAAKAVTPARFKQSPFLDGKGLPDVDDRVPSDPLVIEVFDEIGAYGGTMRRVFTGARDTCNYTRLARSGLTRWSHDGFEARGNIAASWEADATGRSWTVTLREGMHWSDGEPFDADDFVYAYEYMGRIDPFNDELRGSPPAWMRSGSEFASVAKVDNLTVRFIYPNPNYNFPLLVSGNSCAHGSSSKNETYLPEHFLSQYHAGKVGEAAASKAATDAGFESWAVLHNLKTKEASTPELPSMRPWIPVNDSSSLVWKFERNPYYYGVDSDGHQLPYIDKVEMTLTEDRELIQVQAAAGAIDFQYRHIRTDQYPTFKANEEKSGIKVLRWGTAGTTAETSYWVNQNNDGPFGDLLRNQQFRQALAISIDRDRINEISYLGLAQKRSVAPPWGHPHAPEDEAYQSKWTQYDVAEANKMLDAIVPDKDADGFRTYNGEKINLIVLAASAGDNAEMMIEDWKAVGISSKLDVVSRATFETRAKEFSTEINQWGLDTACCLWSDANKQLPVNIGSVNWGNGYAAWWIKQNTGNEVGTIVEPPANVKEMFKHYEDGLTSPPEQGNIHARAIYEEIVDQQYIIPLVGLGPRVAVVNANMGNVPEFAVMDWPFRGPSTAYPEQFYFKK